MVPRVGGLQPPASMLDPSQLGGLEYNVRENQRQDCDVCMDGGLSGGNQIWYVDGFEPAGIVLVDSLGWSQDDIMGRVAR